VKRLIIGLATGRCGTKSLATLLNIQKGVEFYHELCRLPWNVDKDRMSRVFDLFESYDDSIILGDIGPWYVKYVGYLLERFGSRVKFVHMFREDQAVIQSYLKKVKIGNHWTASDSEYMAENAKPSVFDECYPKYDEPKELAIASFVRTHHELCEKIELKIPLQYKRFEMNLFKSESLQKELFRFVELEHAQCCLDIHENMGTEFKRFMGKIS